MTNHHLNGVWFLPNAIFGFEQKHDQTTFCFVLMNSTGNNISNLVLYSKQSVHISKISSMCLSFTNIWADI